MIFWGTVPYFQRNPNELIGLHTHTEEMSQVSSAWRSVKQNDACSALEECPKPLLVDGYIRGLHGRATEHFFWDYHNPLWNTLFTNKYNLTTASFEQCSFHFGDSHSLMFTNLPTSSESNTGLTWQWWLASRCRSVTASESAIGASLEVSRSSEIRLQHAMTIYSINVIYHLVI